MQRNKYTHVSRDKQTKYQSVAGDAVGRLPARQFACKTSTSVGGNSARPTP
jgi:hypothetical protein